MASRRSHAAYHCRSSISAVSRGDTYLSETHCKLRRSAAVGRADSLSPSFGPRSGTDYFSQHHIGSVSPPSGNYMGWKYRTYPQLRCFAACSGFHDIGPAPRNPQLILNLLAFVGAGLRRDAIASYVCYGSLWLSSNKSQFAFVVLSPLRYENLFFMSSCQKYTSSCLHANIVQRVKTCYKIKIDFRVPVCCFFGVLLCKQHPRITIAPLLQSNSATIRQ